MNIDFTKKYYFKREIEGYVKGDKYKRLPLYEKPITGIEYLVRLGDPNNHEWVDFDMLVSEDDVDEFVDSIKTITEEKAAEVKNSLK